MLQGKQVKRKAVCIFRLFYEVKNRTIIYGIVTAAMCAAKDDGKVESGKNFFPNTNFSQVSREQQWEETRKTEANCNKRKIRFRLTLSLSNRWWKRDDT